MIQIDNLNVRFGDFVAVDQLSINVPAGQIFGFLGPNGAGKTTTVRVLTGVLRPTSGKVLIAGHPIPSQLEKVKELCGYVPDTEDHFEELSGRENLKIFASLYRLPIGRVDDVLARLELSEAANLAVSRYSKGMRKKLMIAREILHRPKVLFCDEPTANLDSHSTSVVRNLLMELRGDGTTVFLTTHNMNEVEEICDRVAILSRGRLVDIDTPVAFMTRHAERKVRVERDHDGEQVRQLFDLDDLSARSELAALITSHSNLRVHSLDFRFEDVFRKLTGETYR
ncbi:MAG: ABC transporter ATP-binding protein [Rubripirellula sp.]|nr:ABC transporter ATP-binding protein [Planctomycetaceae bacterium]MDF1844118.1 ABC transporter ATP-binding protein [Rubripirellula sp.]